MDEVEKYLEVLVKLKNYYEVDALVLGGYSKQNLVKYGIYKINTCTINALAFAIVKLTYDNFVLKDNKMKL